MPSALVAGVLLALAGEAAPPPKPAAPEEPAPMRVEGTQPWGTITQVMEPKYPEALLAAKAKDVYVDISGWVAFYGELRDVVYAPGSEEARQMVEPLRAVMRSWRFVVPTNDRCQPTDAMVKNRIWFDFDGERPKISVTHSTAKDPMWRTLKTTKRVDPVFPRAMQVRGFDGWVFLRAKVDPAGKVVEVVTGIYPDQPGEDRRAFGTSVLRAFSQWEFEPTPGRAEDRFVCYEVNFRLRD